MKLLIVIALLVRSPMRVMYGIKDMMARCTTTGRLSKPKRRHSTRFTVARLESQGSSLGDTADRVIATSSPDVHGLEKRCSKKRAKMLVEACRTLMTKSMTKRIKHQCHQISMPQASTIKPEDTPGNTCKVISVCQTFLYGAAGNERRHNINVVLISPKRLIQIHLTTSTDGSTRTVGSRTVERMVLLEWLW